MQPDDNSKADTKVEDAAASDAADADKNPPPGCGDGHLATTEECEGFELRGETCESQGFAGGKLTCDENCRLETSDCRNDCEPEICDGLDNDCDDRVDENLTTRACGESDIGACVYGRQSCKDGAWTECSGALRPSTEVCDGVDNDCDGIVDEGLTRTCGDNNIGQCDYGEEVCQNGEWGACTNTIEPTPEICDGIDNDCDGNIDEGLKRPCGSNVGICERGEQVCQEGAWGECQGDVEPTDESCNNEDDDCDGSTDEGVKTMYYEDIDGDGWGGNSISACSPSGSFQLLQGGDCDDRNSSVYPGATESCYNASEDRDCDSEPACGDTDCEGRECNANGQIGTCQNGQCLAQ
ncbi:MAG: MopE-related protein [Myxococcota bacterium]